MSTQHLVLVNLGTPTAPTAGAVRAFLEEFLSDPAVVDYPVWFWKPFLRGFILRTRPARVARQYDSIWGDDGSPLRLGTERIAAAVRASSSANVVVATAYRYGEPSLDAVMRQIALGEASRVVVVPLFPQRTDPTTGTALRRARGAAARAGIANRLVERAIAPDDAGYVAALVARWREATASVAHAPQHLVISFHGIPVRFNRRERDTYVHDCQATTRAFLQAIGWPAERATLAYQSRFGPEPWLTPATADVLEALPRRGVKRVAVITPGFVTDGLETLEEIGIRGDESFRSAGGEHLLRVGAVEDHPAFVATLASLVMPHQTQQ
ncbi:MAG: ferrochelatase [Gemmatimonadota bacterium]